MKDASFHKGTEHAALNESPVTCTSKSPVSEEKAEAGLTQGRFNSLLALPLGSFGLAVLICPPS